MSTQLKQRVAMADVKGNQAFITIEWLRALNARFAEVAGATTAPTTDANAVAIEEIRGDLASLQLRVSTLETQSANYETRLRAVEGRYAE